MDWHLILGASGPVLASLLAWFLRQIHNRYASLEGDLRDLDDKYNRLKDAFSEHRLNDAKDYALKAEVTREFNAITTMLQRIEDKLDRKVDR